MPSRRLSKGCVPRRKQALDRKAVLLSRAFSGGLARLDDTGRAAAPFEQTRVRCGVIRQPRSPTTIVSLHAGECTLLAAAADVCRSIGPTPSSDLVDRAFRRSPDAIAHIFLSIEVRLDRPAISKDYSWAGCPCPAAPRSFCQPDDVLMHQQAVQSGGKQR
jgi:hypothetical protein